MICGRLYPAHGVARPTHWPPRPICRLVRIARCIRYRSCERSDMKIGARGLQLSPTDMANHVACRHLSVLNLAVAQERLAAPERTAWLPASLQQRGEAHERAYVEHLRSEHLHIVDLRDCRFDADGFNATQEALRRGADVVLQAPLTNDRCVGRADVLRRVDSRRAPGSRSYKAPDTKLGPGKRGPALLPLFAHAPRLCALPGVRPARM